jgi:glutamyl-Q tRNA(Asp) synthetase
MSDYIGRFAPSPTGPLHFGSLLSALASFLDARAHRGRWLLRIEDIDPPREQPGAAAAIPAALRAHGLHWDGEILYQSERAEIYRRALQRLEAAGLAFFCTCSRTALAEHHVYPGSCRARRQPPAEPQALRLLVDAAAVVDFDDLIQGRCRQDLAHEVGDFVIFRKDGLPAYQLAVVVDDAAQGVTHVVRGSDLLDSTPRQIYLQRCLQLPTPAYAHIPVITNHAGQKLSKQTFAAALDARRAVDNLLAALAFLQQPPPPAGQCHAVDAVLDWAITHWQPAAIPRCLSRSGAELPERCRAFAS